MALHDVEYVGTLPAACQVEPEVSSSRSSSSTSVQPINAKWYATLTPAMPPPMTTTLADSRSVCSLMWSP